MISILKFNRKSPCQYCGLKGDDKPTDATENSLFLELDTGDFYYFDGTSWNKVGESGGGTESV
jgi:hypothetical protein